MNTEIPPMVQLYREGYFSPLDYQVSLSLGRISGETDPLVLLAVAMVSRETARGQICVDVGRMAGSPVLGGIGESFSGLRWPEKRGWLAAFRKSALVSDGSAATPLVFDPAGRLYLARYWDYQQRLVAELRSRAGREVAGIDENELARGLDRLFPATLSPVAVDCQRLAAETSVRRYLTVISGGPGTGKTTTVLRLLVLMIDQARAKQVPPPPDPLGRTDGKGGSETE